MEVLFTFKQLNLEVAGEFFVMAATLIEIKSRMLLPKEQQADDPNADDDDNLDPRLDLVHQLVEYKRFKDAAGTLDGLAQAQRNSIALDTLAGWTAPAEDRPLLQADQIQLWNTFNTVLRRLSERIVVGDISDDHITIVDQMEIIMIRLETEEEFAFSTLFETHVSLRTLIVTFLAVLELTRLARLQVRQDASFTEIHCLRARKTA
jgi:segregation and condensation protein A